MIKKSTYIRNLTPERKANLEQLQKETKLKRVPDLLFFALKRYLEDKNDNARLARLLEYNKDKIAKLKAQVEQLTAQRTDQLSPTDAVF